MSASTMEKQGKKTAEKVLAKVGIRPKSAAAIAALIPVTRTRITKDKRGRRRVREVSTTLSAAMARLILRDLAASRKVINEKQGREWVYRLPTVADVPVDAIRRDDARIAE
jgi:hypothetical protein